MLIFFIALIVVGVPAAAAIATLLLGLTTEDWERGKRLGYCLLAIVLAAVSASIAWFGLQGLTVVTWGEIEGNTGAGVTLGIFIVFTVVCLLSAIPRGQKKKPNKSPEPTP